MTTSPIDNCCAHGRGEREQPVVWVRSLLGRQVIGPRGQHLGHVRDVIARWRSDPAPTVVTGLIVDAGGRELSIPATAIRDWQGPQVIVRALPRRRLRTRHPDEFAVARSAIRKPVMADGGVVRRVGDVALRRTPAGWVVWAADTRGAVERFLGAPRRVIEWDVLVGRRLASVPPSTATDRGG